MNRVAGEALALLFPQRLCCHGCGCLLNPAEGLLCNACQQKLDACLLRRSHEERIFRQEHVLAGAAYHYRDMAAALTQSLKYMADKTAAQCLAEGMARRYALMEQLRAAEVCVYVPSHYRQAARRGYAQAQVLCDAFAAIAGLPRANGVLRRVSHAKSQVGMGREERKEHIIGAFVAEEPACHRIKGRCVLLIDDVLTTGATVCECAQVLYTAGAQSVLALTACRV